MPTPALFTPWTEDLAPGIPDTAAVVTHRILYRSAEDRAAARARLRPPGDSMDVDRGDLLVPIEEAPQ